MTNSQILAAIRELLPQTNRVDRIWASATNPFNKNELCLVISIYAETDADVVAAAELFERLQ